MLFPVIVEPPDVIVPLLEVVVVVDEPLSGGMMPEMLVGREIDKPPLLDVEVPVPGADVMEPVPDVVEADPDPVAVVVSEWEVPVAVPVADPVAVSVADPVAVPVTVSVAVPVAVPVVVSVVVPVVVPVAEELSVELELDGFRMDEIHDGKPPGVVEVDEAAVVVETEPVVVATEPVGDVLVTVADPEPVEVTEPESVGAVEPVAGLVAVPEPVAELVDDEVMDGVLEEPVVEGFKMDDSQEDSGSAGVEVEVVEAVVVEEMDVWVSVMDAELVDDPDVDPDVVEIAVVEFDDVADADPELVDDRDEESVDVTEADIDDGDAVVELAGTREVSPSPRLPRALPRPLPVVSTTFPRPSPTSPRVFPTPPEGKYQIPPPNHNVKATPTSLTVMKRITSLLPTVLKCPKLGLVRSMIFTHKACSVHLPDSWHGPDRVTFKPART